MRNKFSILRLIFNWGDGYWSMIGSLIWKCCLYPLPLSHHTNKTESSSFSAVYQSFFKCCSFCLVLESELTQVIHLYATKCSHRCIHCFCSWAGNGQNSVGLSLSLSGGWYLAWEQIPGSRELFKISDSESLARAVNGESANTSLLNLSRLLEVQNVTHILKNAAVCKCLCP